MVKKFDYREPVKSSQPSLQADTIEFLDKNVRFTLRYCSVKRNDCISTVAKDKTVLQALYNRFGHFEKMNWQQARSADHANCISIEPKSSTNHTDLQSEFPDFDTFCHMRVNISAKPKFRVFGALLQDNFCVLKFDVDGKVNH